MFRSYVAYLQTSCTKAVRAYCQSPARLSAANLHPMLHTASPAASMLCIFFSATDESEKFPKTKPMMLWAAELTAGRY
ncbi:MAG: hypothetical protein N2167_04645 [Flavobacteriales bacterium]|nr:hypothetical protein [Flavobacteriales bacterium]